MKLKLLLTLTFGATLFNPCSASHGADAKHTAEKQLTQQDLQRRKNNKENLERILRIAKQLETQQVAGFRQAQELFEARIATAQELSTLLRPFYFPQDPRYKGPAKQIDSLRATLERTRQNLGSKEQVENALVITEVLCAETVRVANYFVPIFEKSLQKAHAALNYNYIHVGMAPQVNASANAAPRPVPQPSAKVPVNADPLTPRLQRTSAKSRADATQTKKCDICMDKKPLASFITLTCRHNNSCKDCLSGMFQSALENKKPEQFKCADIKCKQELTINDVRAVTQDRTKHEQWSELLFKKLLNQNPHIKHCPTKDCSFSIELPDITADRYAKMNCPQCKKTTCFHADFHHSSAINCKEALENRRLGNDLTKDEKANAEWLKAHTKSCPKCNKNIEKNEGCNHMYCTQCKHDFCWLCLGAWNVHALDPHPNCPALQNANANPLAPILQRAGAAADALHVEIQVLERRVFHLLGHDARRVGGIRQAHLAPIELPDFPQELLRNVRFNFIEGFRAPNENDLFNIRDVIAGHDPALEWFISFHPNGWTAGSVGLFIDGRDFE